jgi:integrase
MTDEVLRKTFRRAVDEVTLWIRLDFPPNRATIGSAETTMPHLSPQTLTHGEQKAILRATARNRRDHLIYSLALGTGLRLAEIVGLNVGDVYGTDGKPRTRIRLRPEIAKGGRIKDAEIRTQER